MIASSMILSSFCSFVSSGTVSTGSVVGAVMVSSEAMISSSLFCCSCRLWLMPVILLTAKAIQHQDHDSYDCICNDLASLPSLMSFFPSVLLIFLSLFVCIHFYNSSICTTFLLYMISVGFSTGKLYNYSEPHSQNKKSNMDLQMQAFDDHLDFLLGSE